MERAGSPRRLPGAGSYSCLRKFVNEQGSSDQMEKAAFEDRVSVTWYALPSIWPVPLCWSLCSALSPPSNFNESQEIMNKSGTGIFLTNCPRSTCWPQDVFLIAHCEGPDVSVVGCQQHGGQKDYVPLIAFSRILEGVLGREGILF